MAKTTQPAIPRARYQDVGQQRQSDAIANSLDILTGRKGNGIDKAVTYRELQSLGLANLTFGAGGTVLPVPPPDGGGDGGDGGDAAQPPPAVTNGSATGLFTAILLQWDAVDYVGHSHTEVWRNTTDNFLPIPADGTNPEVPGAVLRERSISNMWGDTVDYGSKYYYWLRHANIIGQVGPLYPSDGSGMYAETSRDLTEVLEDLTGEINDSHLTDALNDEIDIAQEDIWVTTVEGVNPNTGKPIVGGFGVYADPSGAIEAAFNCDKFWIAKLDDQGNVSTEVVPFYVDATDGKVYISEAVINRATIQTLIGQLILAEHVEALTLDAVKITGGTISIGGGNLDIDSSGNLDSNGSAVFDGNVSINSSLDVDGTTTIGGNTTIGGSVTINGSGTIGENMDVLGTITAEQVVGDIVTAITKTAQTQEGFGEGLTPLFDEVTITESRPFSRTLVINVGLTLSASSVGEEGNPSSVRGRVTCQSDEFGERYGIIYRHESETGAQGEKLISYYNQIFYEIPEDTQGTIRIYGQNLDIGGARSAGVVIHGLDVDPDIVGGTGTWTAQLFRNGGDLA